MTLLTVDAYRAARHAQLFHPTKTELEGLRPLLKASVEDRVFWRHLEGLYDGDPKDVRYEGPNFEMLVTEAVRPPRA